MPLPSEAASFTRVGCGGERTTPRPKAVMADSFVVAHVRATLYYTTTTVASRRRRPFFTVWTDRVNALLASNLVFGAPLSVFPLVHFLSALFAIMDDDTKITFEWDETAIMDNVTKPFWDEISTNAWKDLDDDDSRVSFVGRKKNNNKKTLRVVVLKTGEKESDPPSADQKPSEVPVESVSILYLTIVVRRICFVLIRLWFISFYRNLQCESRPS
jgi:hypothetical protein